MKIETGHKVSIKPGTNPNLCTVIGTVFHIKGDKIIRNKDNYVIEDDKTKELYFCKEKDLIRLTEITHLFFN